MTGVVHSEADRDCRAAHSCLITLSVGGKQEDFTDLTGDPRVVGTIGPFNSGVAVREPPPSPAPAYPSRYGPGSFSGPLRDTGRLPGTGDRPVKLQRPRSKTLMLVCVIAIVVGALLIEIIAIAKRWEGLAREISFLVAFPALPLAIMAAFPHTARHIRTTLYVLGCVIGLVVAIFL